MRRRYYVLKCICINVQDDRDFSNDKFPLDFFSLPVIFSLSAYDMRVNVVLKGCLFNLYGISRISKLLEGLKVKA